jgi:hypothetical protein
MARTGSLLKSGQLPAHFRPWLREARRVATLIPTARSESMAEGSGIEGLLGSEPDEREGGSAAPGTDGVALSLALQKTAHDPELSRTASEYLIEQRRQPTR